MEKNAKNVLFFYKERKRMQETFPSFIKNGIFCGPTFKSVWAYFYERMDLLLGVCAPSFKSVWAYF